MISNIIYRVYFLDNRYTRIYFKIVENRRKLGTPVCYCEQHHIIPEQIGGQNDSSNRVVVTAREHFILHGLLRKMCVSGQHRYKMVEAYAAFSINTKRQLKFTSRQQASLREANALAASIRNKGNQAWKSRGPTTPERLQQQQEFSSSCRWINNGMVEKFEIEHQELVESGDWSYGRIKQTTPIKPYDKKICEFCGQYLTIYIFNKFHGSKCNKNPDNHLKVQELIQERIRKEIERKEVERLKRLSTKIQPKKLTCNFCGFQTDSSQNFTRWHGDNCKQNPDNKQTPTKSKTWEEIKESRPLLTCEHCGFQSKIAKNIQMRHGDNCKMAPILSDFRLAQLNKKEMTCQHCSYKTSSGQAYKNHHGENCKQNPNPSLDAIEFRRKWQENMAKGHRRN